MDALIAIATKISGLLRARGDTVAVAESSAGGLISAALLSVPGASSYFLAGGVVYTLIARSELLGITDDDMRGLRSSSEPYAQLLAERTRQRHGATWGLAETGAAGPSGNRYGDPAGHSCTAVAGPVSHVRTLRTDSADRVQNMQTFAATALQDLHDVLSKLT